MRKIEKKKTSDIGLFIALLLLSGMLFYYVGDDFIVSLKESRDVVAEGCMDYSTDMAIETNFPLVMGKCLEYSETVRTNSKKGGSSLEKFNYTYYVVPVYEKNGSYYFAAVIGNSETTEQELTNAVSEYVLYLNRNCKSYNQYAMQFHFKGRTDKMDGRVKAAVAEWLTKNGIVDKNGGGNAEDYIIPIVFAEMDYVSIRALGGLATVMMSIGVLGIIIIVIRKIKKSMGTGGTRDLFL